MNKQKLEKANKLLKKIEAVDLALTRMAYANKHEPYVPENVFNMCTQGTSQVIIKLLIDDFKNQLKELRKEFKGL